MGLTWLNDVLGRIADIPKEGPIVGTPFSLFRFFSLEPEHLELDSPVTTPSMKESQSNGKEQDLSILG